jgi:glutaredoxin
MSDGHPQLVLYSKPGCHLCDEMKHVLDRVRARTPFTLRVVDISMDPDLLARYGLEIPVLEIDGRKVAKYRISEKELEDTLAGDVCGRRRPRL